MKRSKLFQALCILLIAILAMTGCSSKADYEAETEDTSYGVEEGNSFSKDLSDGYSSETDYAMPEEEYSIDAEAPYPESATSAGENEMEDIKSTSSLNANQVQSQDKIIQVFNMDVETQDFDNLITNIDEKIISLGGYTESSQIGGKSYYDSNVTRYGTIVARIPNEKVNEFVNIVDESANVINKNKSTENVSLDYIDAQSRIEALEIEQDRLFAIMEKSEDLESIITLESRLSEIRYELQNYESLLRTYDNEVEYSTVTLNIQEVVRITPDIEKKPTFMSRMKNGFSDTIYSISESFKNFLIWFVVNLPYFLILGLIILVVTFIVRRYVKGKKKNTVPSATLNNGQLMQPQQNQEEEKQDQLNNK